MNKTTKMTYRLARQIAILVVGGSVLLIGIVMIVTPGPAIVVIPLGLAILGGEFAWAKIWLKKIREEISAQNAKRQGRRAEHHRVRHR
jgi:uncharacterized protein (TIGR02611 family)